MLGFCGDLHGQFQHLENLIPVLEDLQQDTGTSIILTQIGDFGYYPNTINNLPKIPFPLYFCTGNHEFFPAFRGINAVTEMADNYFYVPRGEVLMLEGYKMGFLGGAESVDKFWQVKNGNWYEDERITQHQADKLLGQMDLDFLITHTPPLNVILCNFGRLNTQDWKLPFDWKDVSAERVEALWGAIGQPPMICGHMHRSVIDGNCRILDINEFYAVKSKHELDKDYPPDVEPNVEMNFILHEKNANFNPRL